MIKQTQNMRHSTKKFMAFTKINTKQFMYSERGQFISNYKKMESNISLGYRCSESKIVAYF